MKALKKGALIFFVSSTFVLCASRPSWVSQPVPVTITGCVMQEIIVSESTDFGTHISEGRYSINPVNRTMSRFDLTPYAGKTIRVTGHLLPADMFVVDPGSIKIEGACRGSSDTGGSASMSDAGDAVITLERTRCFGTCPVYRVIIKKNGTVTYEGKDHVRVKGRQTSAVPCEKVEDLISEFRKIGYFSLKDSYEKYEITDLPSAITSLSVDGKTKTVRHYYGDSSSPRVLYELEKRIDGIAGTEKWVKGDAKEKSMITPDEAEEIVWNIREVKSRAERIRRSGGKPFTRVESQPYGSEQATAGEYAYMIYFGEDRETHVVRNTTFLVDAYTKKVSVYDIVTDSAVPLEEWLKEQK